MEERKYYVYGYIRLDTNTYFYIGKGKNNRWRSNQRNNWFKKIMNKCQCVCEILYDNLTEEEAFRLEEDAIYDLVFNEGYGINIKGIENEDYYLINCTWGGEGASGREYIPSKKTLEKISKANSINSKNNPNYGMKGKNHSEESKQKMREGHLGNSPNMTEEDKKLRGEKIKEIRMKNKSYGHSQETKDKISNTLKGKMTGIKNGNSKQIICITTGEVFECSRDACRKYNLTPSNLCRALKNHKQIKGLLFMYLKDYNANND